MGQLSSLLQTSPSAAFAQHLKTYLRPLIDRPGLIGAERSIRLSPGETRASRMLVGVHASDLDHIWLVQHLCAAQMPDDLLEATLSSLEGASSLLFALEDRLTSVEHRCYVEWPVSEQATTPTIRGFKWQVAPNGAVDSLCVTRTTDYVVVHAMEDWMAQVIPMINEPLAFWLEDVLRKIGPPCFGDLMRVAEAQGVRQSACIRADRAQTRLLALIPSIRLLMLEWGCSPTEVSRLETRLQGQGDAEISWLAFGNDQGQRPFLTLYSRFNSQDLRNAA